MPSTPHIVFYGLWPELHEYTKKQLGDLPATLHSEPITLKNADETATILGLFIESPVTREIFDHLPKLTYIAAMSTGYDHIDLAAAKASGIAVSNVPTYGENTVAEHTFALILGLTRKIFQSVKRVKEGTYDFHGLRGIDLKDKTLGIIGTGHIGAHIARIAKGFEMQVLAYDAFPNQATATTIGFTYTTLEKLLEQSDIVSLHVPLLSSTHHLINKEKIGLMKHGSLLINTARGALIDPEALLEALNTGQLSGAGLDVLEDENLLQNFEEVMRCKDANCKIKTTLINNLIIDHPNTIVTPHNAFNSIEALERIIDVTAENIKSFISGQINNRIN